LKALIWSEQRGDIAVMRTLLASIGDDIATDGDVDEVREFSRLLMRMIASIDHEAAAGKGSLMNWGDPENVRMLEAGLFNNRFPDLSHGLGSVPGVAS
jgi:hypothetical protein